MKHLFYSGLIFLFLVFNCTTVFAAPTSDFSGTFNGTESGSTSSKDSGSYSGSGTGTFSGSGSGSIDNAGSIANYIVYCKVASSLSSLTGDTTNGNYSFVNIGSQYYLSNVPNTPYVPTTPNKSNIYICCYKPTGAIFYTNATTYLADVFTPVTLAVGNGYSDFTFKDSGTTTSKDSGTYSGTGTGSYSGSVTGTLAGAVENYSGLGGYPPAFPSSTGLSYSDVYSYNFFTTLTISSPGVSISPGSSYALLPVTYIFSFEEYQKSLPTGSYLLNFASGGSATGSGGFPTYLSNSFYYVVALSNGFNSDTFVRGDNFNVTAFRPSFISNYGNYVYFDKNTLDPFSSSSSSADCFSFIAYIFVTSDISSFSRVITPSTGFHSSLYVTDSNLILDQLQSQSNALTSAGGANSGLNSQNNIMAGALSDYQRDTDTSAQYSNIGDNLFVLDTSIFTQVASTITLFSSVVTGLFTAFGDFSVPLTLMLIVTFVSCIIGIIKITSDSS